MKKSEKEALQLHLPHRSGSKVSPELDNMAGVTVFTECWAKERCRTWVMQTAFQEIKFMEGKTF